MVSAEWVQIRLVAVEKKENRNPLLDFGIYMPEEESDLLDGEKPAFRALYTAKRNKAIELQLESYKVAQHRSLCEVVRNKPTTRNELRLCWGFGGSGVRVDKYGDMFLDALRPFLSELCELHTVAAAEAEVMREAESAAEATDVSCSGRLLEMPQIPDLLIMPQIPDDLMDGERSAYESLIAATHARAEEPSRPYPFHTSLHRILPLPTPTHSTPPCIAFHPIQSHTTAYNPIPCHCAAPHLAAPPCTAPHGTHHLPTHPTAPHPAPTPPHRIAYAPPRPIPRRPASLTCGTLRPAGRSVRLSEDCPLVRREKLPSPR